MIELLAPRSRLCQSGPEGLSGAGIHGARRRIARRNRAERCGKSSLLRLVAGLLQPAGVVVLRAPTPSSRSPNRRTMSGTSMPSSRRLTVEENLLLEGRFRGVNDVAGALAAVGLGAPLICLRSISLRGSGGVSRSPACWSPPGRFGSRRAELEPRCGGSGDGERDHGQASAGGGLILAVEHGGFARRR